MAAASSNKDIPKMNFEDALAELERIVQQLESGDVALEDSILIYERGEALKSHCEKKLQAAETKVEKIIVGSDGMSATGVEASDIS
ncbi:exodeoxyribonuclease VII small subunit [Hirschia baltica]|uniref:Exodeoxyribonuclease 7 small subunit n=1 Tax=Hirschia baltica (strain ATCC 49814 / DSM 5838 / IFAM 1418) TaxID=582402 RepID=C6XI52_HIRBI|nr:exodeoxyribonuclease VII small subunit [Hirschia baltica]ACT58878.1 exodeoxyribonuclease VII, small subunit [Hirschia baltica ATCC 49814]